MVKESTPVGATLACFQLVSCLLLELFSILYAMGKLNGFIEPCTIGLAGQVDLDSSRT